jgi:hypothetical protein
MKSALLGIQLQVFTHTYVRRVKKKNHTRAGNGSVIIESLSAVLFSLLSFQILHRTVQLLQALHTGMPAS